MRACYEASGAGYVLQRSLTEWGVVCDLAPPSLIPRRPGEHRKTDRRDAIKLARDHRDDRLVLIHIPTSGDRQRIGGITKAGNTHTRHVLIQAAWHDRNQPRVGIAPRRRQQGHDPAVIAHAWKCQHRLYGLFHRLAARKPKQVAATAVVREMGGFPWAVLEHLGVSELQRRQEDAHAA